MPFSQINGIRFYQFEIFPDNITQAVFTRQGGVSPAPWNSLNVGGSVGDDLSHVVENRIRSFRALGRAPESIHDVWQVHSSDVVIATEPRRMDEEYVNKADIILTDNTDLTLFMRFADCTPVLLYDPLKHVVGIVHSGWLGTVRSAARVAVDAMVARFGTNPSDLLAAVGPSIGPDHYEVGEDVIARVNTVFNKEAPKLLEYRAGRTYFNLWAANRLLLEKAGVQQIEMAQICTACNPTDWFSHRGEKGRTGRFGAMIALS